MNIVSKIIQISNLKINYYWVDLDKIYYALNFLKNVIIKAKKEEKDKYEEKLKNLFGEEIEKLLGIQSNTNNYLYSIIKKIYPKYLDFRIRSIKLKVLKNAEQKEILRSLLKDRTIIQKKYDNGIIEFKADYFYNIKNKSIHKKYNDLYNNMIETAISNLILSLPEYFQNLKQLMNSEFFLIHFLIQTIKNLYISHETIC